MKQKKFDLYEYVHKNKITLKPESTGGETVSKSYNDIRKTRLNEAKIVDGKFSLKESLKEGERSLAPEVKKHFLEIISTYRSFKEQMSRTSDIVKVAEVLGGIVEAAKTLTLAETDDWFDKVTIKRNMSELEKLDKDFDKFSTEAKALDERLHALYEDMGNILARYYEISDIDADTTKQRLGEGIRKGQEVVLTRPLGSFTNMFSIGTQAIVKNISGSGNLWLVTKKDKRDIGWVNPNDVKIK